jgi:hypothetical protein
MQGRRIHPGPDGYFPDKEIKPGDYWKDRDGHWGGKTPNGIRCGLTKHFVVEHEDGTITVSPSILVDWNTEPHLNWHGFLERGIWREC